MDVTYLFFCIVFSVIGMGYCAYGKKNNPYYMLTGLALLMFPYFVSSFVWLMVIGILLVLLPFLLERILPY